MNSTSSSTAGKSARERWKHCKEQFDELGRSIQDFRLWLESMLIDSSPGSAVARVSPSSPSGSQST